MDRLKLLVGIASYIGLVVMLIGLGIKRIRKSTAQDLKIKSHDEKFDIMDKKIEKNNKEQTIEITKIHALVEIIRKENNTQYVMYTKNNSEQHSKLFDQLGEVSEGISEINGYLKAKQEK